jgi:hypothetical protein
LNIKKEQPKTVNAKKKANIINPGNKLNVLKVSQEKLNIKIHERSWSMILLVNFMYLEEKRLNPITIILMFIENIKSKMIANNMKKIVRKIPASTIK